METITIEIKKNPSQRRLLFECDLVRSLVDDDDGKALPDYVHSKRRSFEFLLSLLDVLKTNNVFEPKEIKLRPDRILRLYKIK
jgi:hypothetical protein